MSCRNFKSVIYNIGADARCDVHLMVLGIREGKEGWFHIYCPGNIACDDEGVLWSELVSEVLLITDVCKHNVGAHEGNSLYLFCSSKIWWNVVVDGRNSCIR